MTPRRRRRHGPEQGVAKLRVADAMLTAGKELAAVPARPIARCCSRVGREPPSLDRSRGSGQFRSRIPDSGQGSRRRSPWRSIDPSTFS